MEISKTGKYSKDVGTLLPLPTLTAWIFFSLKLHPPSNSHDSAFVFSKSDIKQFSNWHYLQRENRWQRAFSWAECPAPSRAYWGGQAAPQGEERFFPLIFYIILFQRWCPSRLTWRWSRLTPTGLGRGGATSLDPGLSETDSPSFSFPLLQTRKTRRDPMSCLSPTISLYYALMGI